ncbi:alpha/beta hydrolase [Chloroflexota bacterium]
MSNRPQITNKQGIFIAGALAGSLLTAAVTTIIALEWRRYFRPSLRSRAIYWLMRLADIPNYTTPVELRAKTDQLYAKLDIPAGVTIRPAQVGGIPAEWIGPTKAAGDGVILYLHGGAYTAGSPTLYRGLTSRLALASGTRALSIDYRLAPEHPFPAALDDALAAYRGLLESGIKPQNIIVVGDSAGGGLTTALLVSLRDSGDPLPAGAVLISPWTDLAGTGASILARANVDPILQWSSLKRMADGYRGDYEARHPLVSPLYADLRDLPPLLIQVGDLEILLHDATRLAERAEAVGVDVTLDRQANLWHDWPMFAQLVPESQEAIERIGDFIRERLGE